MAQESRLSTRKLHYTFYNDLFVLKTTVTINGQPAEIDFSTSGEVLLKCRYPERSFPFSGASSQLEGLLKKHGVCQISNVWFDAAPCIQVGFCMLCDCFFLMTVIVLLRYDLLALSVWVSLMY